MSDTATAKQTRQRTPLNDFARQLQGFVKTVEPKKLAARVAALLGESDHEKVLGSINGFVRKAGKENGVVSVRSQKLAEAIISTVTELDSATAPMGEKIHNALTFSPISSAGRDSSTNWIVRLKAGEPVETDGPDGQGTYKLVKVSA